jgi:hypothetical protein
MRKSNKLAPPRSLKGRRARKIWREMVRRCDDIGTFNTGTAQLLAVLCALLAEAGGDPSAANHGDLAQIRSIGRSLGIFR